MCKCQAYRSISGGEGNLELAVGGVAGMTGRSQQASGDMCGPVHWKERRKEARERGIIAGRV